MKSVCVFCGSNPGDRPEYTAAAQALGRELAARNMSLVYGGGKVGLMGTIADAALAAGGEVIGVITHALVAKEVAHRGLTELHVVDSMHARKALMAARADAFIAMPGGFGTLDEFFEVVTWNQLGIHQKPCGLLNVADYYAPVVTMFEHAVEHGFVRAEQRAGIQVEVDPAQLIERLLHRR